MAWITPKTNWTADDYITHTDFNRIRGNLLDVNNKEVSMFGGFECSIPTAPSLGDGARSSKWNSVETALDTINKNGYRLDIGDKAVYTDNGFTIDYTELNRIENALLTIHNKLATQEGNDKSPVITITSNTTDWINTTMYTITGTVVAHGEAVSDALVEWTSPQGAKSEALTLTSNGVFSKTIELHAGAYEITVRAKSTSGQLSVQRFTKRVDTSNPTLSVTGLSTNAASPTIVTAASWVISGSIGDSYSGISTVKVNGNNATLSGRGTWSYTLENIPRGSVYTVTIVATDVAGNQKTITRYIKYDATAPTITVTSSLATTPVRAYTLTGTITDADSGVTSVTINGEAVALVNSAFSKAYSLNEGVNTFTILATDGAGNTGRVDASITLVNQGANASYNLTQTQTLWSNNNGNYNKQVVAGGQWYTYAKQESTQAPYNHDLGGYEHTTASIGITQSIPLPKGLSYAAFSGWNCQYMYIRDASTGSYIATGQNSVAANISQAQAMHDLYLDFKASASQTQYQNARADGGVSDGWTLYYY